MTDYLMGYTYKENYIIFNDDACDLINLDIQCRCAVFACLYYSEELEKYLDFLSNVPSFVDIYIISSNETILKKASEFNKNYIISKKPNRGRDISALLIEVNKNIRQYDYICFLHDKKEKNARLKKDTDIWKYGMWDNMIGSENHIYKVIDFFSNNPNIGLLVPPAPIGEYNTGWFGPLWYDNYNNTVNLAKSLGIKIHINEEENPPAVGTIFWARTNALIKLFCKNWYYEDFDEEPLPDNGTLSHAIERIIPYVVEDSGYSIHYLMTNSYASWMFNFICDGMSQMYDLLNKKLGIDSLHELSTMNEQKESIVRFCEKFDSIYLYGAGKYGKKLLARMREWNLEPYGFVVSKKENLDIIENKPVFEIEELRNNNTAGIIVAVSYQYQDEMVRKLKELEMDNYIIGYI